MNIPLFRLFKKTLAYNSLSFIAYKIIFISISYMLFMFFSPADYLHWGNTMALVYLTVLWADFGLRKSIAQFAPYFFDLKSIKIFNRFLIFYATMLILAGLILAYIINAFYTTKILVFLLVITEGTVSLLRSLFHARFENKYFNLVYTSFFAFEAIIIALFVFGFFSLESVSLFLLSMTDVILLLRIINSVCVISFIAPRMKQLFKVESQAQFPLKDFFKHCAILSTTTVARSITERNMLLPMVTYFFGPIIAAPCKIAQDTAIVFQRFLFKSLGTSDSAFLAALSQNTETPETELHGFYYMSYYLIVLCIPVLFFVSIASLSLSRFDSFQKLIFNSHTQAFQFFIIFIIFFMLESLLSPYERFLEVKRNYKLLLISYAPYSILFAAIASLFASGNLQSITTFLIGTQGARFSTGILHAALTHYYYDIQFPLKLLAIGITACIIFTAILYFIFFYII